ncbi:MAG: tRNA uridine-5-carboxymethylaminomethyl(34) synthesis GTPase MnmE, partial [Nitrospira sp.]
GEGGVGIVRISGRRAIAVAEKIVRLRSGRRLRGSLSHCLHVADMVFPKRTAPADPIGEPAGKGEEDFIDQGLVVWMKAPRSYTGEDVVELHCHGSQMVLRLLCEACVQAGARLAEPGEFTKRAFLNGRLDLSQAEAVLETITATTEAALRMAQRNLRGELGRLVNELRERLLVLLCEIEAGIDFVEEDVTFISPEQLAAGLEDTLAHVERLLNCAETGRRVREGARVVIVGPPNVGKSSLLNVLLGENRAIVTDVPGTTRDLIEESVVWDGLQMALIDTAGVRDTDDVVEQEGIKRTRTAIEESDAVILVFDVREAANVEEGIQGLGLVPRHQGQHKIVVLNKCDLVPSELAAEAARSVADRCGLPVVVTSVRTGWGLDHLKQAIRRSLTQDLLEPREAVVFVNARHRQALERAKTALINTRDSIRNKRGAEVLAVDLREAADALGEITGAITSDEILNRIFSQFCVGK